MKIGAKIFMHSRYVTFQMAEVAVPRDMFAEILRLIAQLRVPPTRDIGGPRSRRSEGLDCKSKKIPTEVAAGSRKAYSTA